MKSSKRKGILFVINDFNVGGAEVFILRLGTALSLKYDVYITDINPYKSDEVFKNRFKINGFQFINSQFSFSRKIDWFLWKINAFLIRFGKKNFYTNNLQRKRDKYWEKQLQVNNIKIINSHLLASDLFTFNKLVRFKDQFDFKWIVTLHSSYNSSHYITLNNELKQDFINQAESIFNKADAAICVADLNKDIFKEFSSCISPQKIYLGYDPNEKDENNDVDFSFLEKYFVFSMVARGIVEKGWEIAIEAFIKCLDYSIDIRFVIICPLTDYMLSLKKRYGHIEQIIFTDFLKSPVAVLKYSNVGLLPSYYGESLPYSIIECLGNSLPVIASDRGELREMLIADGEDDAGFILENNQLGLPSESDLFNKMMLLINNEYVYQKLKLNTLKAFYKFDIKTCVQQYELVFEEINKEEIAQQILT